jgi:CIC family chloride channel protein
MLQFYVELPAFLILGLVSRLIAVVFMRATFWAEDMGNFVQRRTGMPRWLRPAIAGLLLGAIAIWFPHIIGVGYETTSAALTGQLLLHEAIVFTIVKAAAAAITIAGRMGGGVFSPSLMLGALSGLAFGIIATGRSCRRCRARRRFMRWRGWGGGGRGAGRADLDHADRVRADGRLADGACGDGAVSMSTALASRLVDRSFFLTQLERRNIHLAAGPQAYLLAMFRVGRVMRPMDHENAAPEERLADADRAGGLHRHQRHAGTGLADLRAHRPRFRAGGAAGAGGRAARAGGGAVPRRRAQGLQQGARGHGGGGAFLTECRRPSRLSAVGRAG